MEINQNKFASIKNNVYLCSVKFINMNLETLNKYQQDGLLYSQVHPTLPLTIWNYTDKVQWENLWDEITLSCRGLVTDDLGNIVARPFRKFFNLSEGRTNITDTYEIFEKYDGSLGILFFYGENWIFASRGSFTSEQAIKGKEILDGYNCYNTLDKNNTYCFEIIYPENKIVVNYEDFEDCILTAVFNTLTGEEQDLYLWELPIASSYNIQTSLKELHTVIRDCDEGYVVRFSNGERCKIKGAEYLRLHKMMSEMSTTAVWDCLRNGDSILELIHDFPDEFYNSVKEYEEELKQQYTNKLEEINEEFYSIINRKEFAENVLDRENKHFLFTRLNSFSDSLKEQIWNYLKPEYRRL
jgi:RNA ligase